MTDKPGSAIRGKPKSSMIVGLKLQADGESDAFVSAGNTGAQMAASMVVLKLHAGLKRPAIATVFPTARKPVVVLDSGANVDCGADELVQFAQLGVVYAEDLLGRDNPAVGLLSIGEEPEKGNAVVKEAHQLLAVGRPQLRRQRRGTRPADRTVRPRPDRRRRLRRVRRQCRAQVLRSDRAVHHRAAGEVRHRSGER